MYNIHNITQPVWRLNVCTPPKGLEHCFMTVTVNSCDTCCFHSMRKSAAGLKAQGETPKTNTLTSAVNPRGSRPGPGSGRRASTWHGSTAGDRWAPETEGCPELTSRPHFHPPKIPRWHPQHLPRQILETLPKKAEWDWAALENWRTSHSRPRRVLSPGPPALGRSPAVARPSRRRLCPWAGAPRRFSGGYFHREDESEAARQERYCWGTAEPPVSFSSPWLSSAALGASLPVCCDRRRTAARTQPSPF